MMEEKKPFGLVTDEDTGEQGYDEMQPGGLCHYDGPEAALPVGGYSAIPGWGPERAAKRWLVADPEADKGYSQRKSSELRPDDIVVGVEISQDLINLMVETYGDRFFLIREANGGPQMTIAEWRARFNTDGFALLAIRNKRQELAGRRKIIKL